MGEAMPIVFHGWAKVWSGGGITEETVWEKSALKAEAPDRPPIPSGAAKLSHINFGPRDFAA